MVSEPDNSEAIHTVAELRMALKRCKQVFVFVVPFDSYLPVSKATILREIAGVPGSNRHAYPSAHGERDPIAMLYADGNLTIG